MARKPDSDAAQVENCRPPFKAVSTGVARAPASGFVGTAIATQFIQGRALTCEHIGDEVKRVRHICWKCVCKVESDRINYIPAKIYCVVKEVLNSYVFTMSLEVGTQPLSITYY